MGYLYISWLYFCGDYIMIILRKIALQSQEIYRNGTVVADTISGTLNGSNQVFYTTYSYKRDRIDLHFNGQALHTPYDSSRQEIMK